MALTHVGLSCEDVTSPMEPLRLPRVYSDPAKCDGIYTGIVCAATNAWNDTQCPDPDGDFYLVPAIENHSQRINLQPRSHVLMT